MKGSAKIFGVITVLLILLRIIFNENSQLLYIVTFINLLELLIVIWSVLERVKESILKDIKSYPKQLFIREKRRINYWLWFSYILVIVIYTIYFAFFCSELMNDIISILALGLSLSDDSIVKHIVNIYEK